MTIDPTPVPTGPEFRVDAAAAQFQFNPAAAALVGGGFVVVRHTFNPAAGSPKASYFGSDVYAQLHADHGTPVGGEVRVNTYETGHQGSPRVAALADGGFAVTWESASPGQRHPVDVYVRRFGADGVPAGDEVRVHHVPGGSQDDPRITALADGGFVVAYTGYDPSGGGVRGLYAWRFAADGAAVGDRIPVDTNAGSSSDIAALADGGFVVTWIRGATGGPDVYARRFAADGVPAGDAFLVHANPDGSQNAPRVAALADGGFVVTWSHDAEPSIFSEPDATDVHAQRFDSEGVRVGNEFRVHDTTDGYQDNQGAWALADGRFAVSWRGPDPSAANGSGLYGRFFEASGGSGQPAPSIEPWIVAPVSSLTEGDAGAMTSFPFDIGLFAAPWTSQSVRWQVEGYGPDLVDAADFAGGVLPSGEIVFAAGETRKTITVHVVGDGFVEGDERFMVRLLPPSSGLDLNNGIVIVAILDDDPPFGASPTHAAQVTRLYEAALDRAAEREGFAFWVGALEKGEALSTLASSFLASAEYQARFGDAAGDGAFVDRLYRNVLGRAGEAEGRSFWNDALGKGCSRAEVLVGFSESAENVALTATALRSEADFFIG